MKPLLPLAAALALAACEPIPTRQQLRESPPQRRPDQAFLVAKNEPYSLYRCGDIWGFSDSRDDKLWVKSPQYPFWIPIEVPPEARRSRWEPPDWY